MVTKWLNKISSDCWWSRCVGVEKKNALKTLLVVLPRVCVSRSSIQNCRAATVAFHTEYSLAIGKSSMVFMLIYVLWFTEQDVAVLKISWSIYTNVWKHYCEIVWMVLDDPTAIKTHALWRVDMYHLCIVHQRGRVLWCGNGVNQLLTFNQLSIIDPLGTAYGAIPSLTTEVTCISVFPGFWRNFLKILVQELPMTSTVAYINSPSM